MALPDWCSLFCQLFASDWERPPSASFPWLDESSPALHLTPIGAPAPDLHIAKGIPKNSFTIAGGKAGMKVSWQLTGVRKDRWAEKNRIVVEEEKAPEHRGRYLDPLAHSKPATSAIAERHRPDQAGQKKTAKAKGKTRHRQ
jgi:hypothetical protein